MTSTTLLAQAQLEFIRRNRLHILRLLPVIRQHAGLNISYNVAQVPNINNRSRYTSPVWGPFVVPTKSNVIYAFSGVKGAAATGAYYAWRYLWEVTPNTYSKHRSTFRNRSMDCLHESTKHHWKLALIQATLSMTKTTLNLTVQTWPAHQCLILT